MTQSTRTDLLKRIAFFLQACVDPQYNIVDIPEIDNRKYYNPKRNINMATQIKKVGKNTYPNRVNRSTHYIGQPRSTGGNH